MQIIATSPDKQTVNASNRCQASGRCKRLSSEQRSALCAIPAGIVFVSPRGIVELANSPACELFEQNIEGMLWREVVNNYFEPKEDDGLEVSLRNGQKLKFSLSKLPNVPGQLIHLTDLTQTRKLQANISHMKKLSALGKMVASLAHQLRTPLSAALLYAANLGSNSISNETRKSFASKLVSRLKELENQINDMLLFAKSGQGGVLDTFDLVALVNQVIEDCKASIRSDTVRISFDCEHKPEFIKANSCALKGAIGNLLHNAMQAGGNQIQVKLGHHDEGLKFIITDNGPGIPESAVHKIFEPFFTTRSQGTGLGLAVVKSVVTSHNGKVSVRNLPTGGAEFTFVLPHWLRQQATIKTPSMDHPDKQLTGELA